MDTKELTIQEQPAEMVTQGKNNAKLLMDIVSQKNWAVNIGGKKYLQFEAWQTLAKFYGLTVRTVETKYVEYGNIKGFEARSEVVNKDGNVIGAGEGACLTDEKTWNGRPLFSLKAMAQTRASGRALRQMLSWIAVLGGYAPTAAEEMPREVEVVREPSKPASDKQVVYANNLIVETETDYNKIYEFYGIKKLEELDTYEAIDLIDKLKKKKERIEMALEEQNDDLREAAKYDREP